MAKKYVVQKKTGIDVKEYRCKPKNAIAAVIGETCLLYTSDAADE